MKILWKIAALVIGALTIMATNQYPPTIQGELGRDVPQEAQPSDAPPAAPPG